MINLISKRCEIDGCHKQPTFGFKGRQPSRCKSHTEKGMINQVCKRCEIDGCDIIPCYGFKGQQPSRCKSHIEEGMLDLVHKRCEIDGCDKQPKFAFKGQQPSRCKRHTEKGMIDLTSKRCKLCPTRSNPKYRGYCTRCFLKTFPNEPISRNYKIKQKHFEDYIKQSYPNEDISFDTTTGGCFLWRPDVLIDKYTHSIILECDKTQHTGYDTTCEEARINELFTDLADRPIIFIRFNPDGYTNKDNKKQQSCFKYHKKTSVPMIRCTKEWGMRLNVLKNTIDYYLNVKSIPKEPITIVQLFFDGYDMVN
jgi:hypothetical protein